MASSHGITVVKSSPRPVAVLDIPDDVIFDILTRLPAKSIIRFRSVCKSWLAMLSSRRFIDAHLRLSKSRPSMLIVAREFSRQRCSGWRTMANALWMGYYKYDNAAGDDDDVAEAIHSQHHVPCGDAAPWAVPLHCDGLILFYTADQIMVCNPATRECLSLPKQGSDRSMGFGRDPCTNKYKLVRPFDEIIQVVDGTAICILRFEVLTLGTNNVWRRIVSHPRRLSVRSASVHARGFIYWTSYRENDAPVLARFSLADETFSEVPYPPFRSEGYAHFTKLDGEEFCSVFVPGTCQVAQVWVITCNNGSIDDGTDDDNNKPAAWSLRFTVSLPQETIALCPCWHRPMPPVFHFRGKDMFMRGGRKLYMFNTETGEMKKVDVAVEDLRYYHPESNGYKEFSGDQVAALRIVNYTESLVPIREEGYDDSSSVKQRVFAVVAGRFNQTCNMLTNGWAAYGFILFIVCIITTFLHVLVSE